MEIVGTRGQILMAKCTKIDFGWGCAPDPLVGWGEGYPFPIPYPSAPIFVFAIMWCY